MFRKEKKRNKNAKLRKKNIHVKPLIIKDAEEDENDESDNLPKKRKWEISHGLQDGFPTTTSSLRLTEEEAKSMGLPEQFKKIRDMDKDFKKALKEGKTISFRKNDNGELIQISQEESKKFWNEFLKKRKNKPSKKERDESLYNLLFNNADILEEEGKLKKAIECYDKILEIKPKDWQVLFNKAQILVRLRKYNEAIKCYDKAIIIYPKDKTAFEEKQKLLKKLNKKKV